MSPIIIRAATLLIAAIVLFAFRSIPPRHKVAHYCLLVSSAIVFGFLAAAAA